MENNNPIFYKHLRQGDKLFVSRLREWGTQYLIATVSRKKANTLEIELRNGDVFQVDVVSGKVPQNTGIFEYTTANAAICYAFERDRFLKTVEWNSVSEDTRIKVYRLLRKELDKVTKK